MSETLALQIMSLNFARDNKLKHLRYSPSRIMSENFFPTRDNELVSLLLHFSHESKGSKFQSASQFADRSLCLRSCVISVLCESNATLASTWTELLRGSSLYNVGSNDKWFKVNDTYNVPLALRNNRLMTSNHS